LAVVEGAMVKEVDAQKSVATTGRKLGTVRDFEGNK
jgi:hypothetical protein